MIQVTQNGQTFKADAFIDDWGADGNYYLLGVSFGFDGIRVLVRADSLDSAIDALVESNHGASLRIDDDDLYVKDSDYLCDHCLAQMELPPGERNFDQCEGDNFHFTDGGIAYDNDHLGYGSDAPVAVDFFVVDDERLGALAYSYQWMRRGADRARAMASDPMASDPYQRRMDLYEETGDEVYRETAERFLAEDRAYTNRHAASEAWTILGKLTRSERANLARTMKRFRSCTRRQAGGLSGSRS